MVAVVGGRVHAGGVCDRAGAEQHKAVDPLSLYLFLQSAETLPAHPGEVRHGRDRRPADGRFCRPTVDGSTSSPRPSQ